MSACSKTSSDKAHCTSNLFATWQIESSWHHAAINFEGSEQAQHWPTQLQLFSQPWSSWLKSCTPADGTEKRSWRHLSIFEGSEISPRCLECAASPVKTRCLGQFSTPDLVALTARPYSFDLSDNFAQFWDSQSKLLGRKKASKGLKSKIYLIIYK